MVALINLLLHMYINEPFLFRWIMRILLCFAHSNDICYIIHIKGYINRPPLWKRSIVQQLSIISNDWIRLLYGMKNYLDLIVCDPLRAEAEGRGWELRTITPSEDCLILQIIENLSPTINCFTIHSKIIQNKEEHNYCGMIHVNFLSSFACSLANSGCKGMLHVSLPDNYVFCEIAVVIDRVVLFLFSLSWFIQSWKGLEF